jgi:hypothetical protein
LDDDTVEEQDEREDHDENNTQSKETAGVKYPSMEERQQR